MAAQLLVEQKHQATLHARNDARVKDALRCVPGAEGGIAGDLSTLVAMRQLAEQANASVPFDDTLLAFAVARRWPDVLSNSVEPGAAVKGRHFYRQRARAPNPAVTDTRLQQEFLERCANLSGVPFPV